jgi:hypothetical protein
MGYSSRPNKTYNEAHQISSVYDKMSEPTRMAGSNKDKGKATDALGAMVTAVPVVRAAGLGAQRDPEQARSLGRNYWLSNEQVKTR